MRYVLVVLFAVIGGSSARAECVYNIEGHRLCLLPSWCLDRELGHCTDPYDEAPLATAGHQKGDFARKGGHFYLYDGTRWHIMPQDAPPDDKPPD